MLTGPQIRSARAALGWSAQELADKAGVSMKTVMRLESADGVPPSRSDTLSGIQMALESAGIEFIGSPTDGPGLRIRTLSTRSE
jgi:transcriptional regulator with XRE-family HTH domain